MFVIMLSYLKPLEAVEKELERHLAFLDKYYESGNFFCSGRQNPRVGGVILCKAKDKDEVEKIITDDPFYIERIAEYEITEFIPTRYAEGFEWFIR